MNAEIDPSFLRADEQLVRVHRFRYVTAQGCALGGVEIVVEEFLGDHLPAGAPRCSARPFHERLVTKPEYQAEGDSVTSVLRLLIERMRSRPLSEAFLPAR